MTDLIPGWFPPTRERWELVTNLWQFFPLFTVAQYLTDFYPQGKTSIDSKWNLPGKWAWLFMESPGFLTVLYCMCTIPANLGLSSAPGIASFQAMPVANKTMALVYTVHYIYRAILSPLVLNPSMSAIHPFIFCSAAVWQVINGLSLGGWLAGYGPTTVKDWEGQGYYIFFGLLIWCWGLLANVFHDEELREIRREALKGQRKMQAEAEAKGEKYTGRKGVDKIYKLPKNALFNLILYPHFLCEWIEWAGFWMVGGSACIPARSFLLNEVSTMLPRAMQGRRWYIDKFGREAVGNRKAIIPFLLHEDFVQQLKQLHEALSKALVDIVGRWFSDTKTNLPARIPLEQHEDHLLRWMDGPGRSLVPPYPSKAGLWRPNYLIERTADDDPSTERIVICEITSRFPYDGNWAVTIHQKASENLVLGRSLGPDQDLFDQSKPLYILKDEGPGFDVHQLARHYQNTTGQKSLFVKPSDLRLREDPSTASGYASFWAPPDPASEDEAELLVDGESGSGVLSEERVYQASIELYQHEMARMSAPMLQHLSTICINDMRSILLIHDKRMLAIPLEELEDMVSTGVLSSAEAQTLKAGIALSIRPGSQGPT